MHNCRNPQYCPFCRQKIKNNIEKEIKKHPNIPFSNYDIAKMFNLKWWVARNVLYSLEKRGIIIKSYRKTKRFTIGSGVKIFYTYVPNKYRPIQVNPKAWIKIF